MKLQLDVYNGVFDVPERYITIYNFPIGFRIKAFHVQYSKCADIHVSEHLCLFTIPARYS